ncbi:MAG: hypothetical protein WDN45_06580 [Caulobacteraceae bacterium]
MGGLRLTAMTPEQRIETALAQGSIFHPASYRKEFLTGASVAWARVPWTLGCCARWSEEDARPSTTRPSWPWITGWSWPGSTPPTSAAGWRAPCSRPSTPSPACTSAPWRPDDEDSSTPGRDGHPDRRPGAGPGRHRKRRLTHRYLSLERRGDLQCDLRRLPHAGRQGRDRGGDHPRPGRQSPPGRRPPIRSRWC